MVGLLVVLGQLESAHGRSDPAGDLVTGGVEAHRGLELAASPEVLFELSDRVEVLGRLEAAGGGGNGADPVDPIRAGCSRAMRAAEQVPVPVTGHDRPRVDVFFPRRAAPGDVGDADPLSFR
jgi:hypothetical protein